MTPQLVTIALTLASVCDGLSLRREASNLLWGLSSFPGWFDNGADLSEAFLNFANTTQVHSNLGGYGPDGGLQAIVYDDVGTYKGQKLDFVITATSEYTAYDNTKNMIKEEGQLGQINIKCGTSVDLVAHIVKSGTWANSPIENNEVVLPIFFMSVLDFDAAAYDETEKKGVEDVRMKQVFGYKAGSLVDVTEYGPQEYQFTATVKGTGGDNPTDAWALTQEQKDKAFLVSFRNASSVSMTFAATSCTTGRNILFTGPSSMSEEPPASCKKMQTVDLNFATLSINNLDGHDAGDAVMQFDNITIYEGNQIDMKVTATSGNYKGYDLDKNSLNGQFAQINVDGGVSVVFRFELFSGGYPTSISNFFFAFWDIDGTDDKFEKLSMVGSSGTYFLSSPTLLTAIKTPEKVTFQATEYGNFADNPDTDDSDVTERQKETHVEFAFEKTVQYWDIEFDTADFLTGRNFEFSGSITACS